MFPTSSNLGTWQQYATVSPEVVCKKPIGMSELECSMLSVNIFSAYRMLKDFGNLQRGHVLIQVLISIALNNALEWGK